VAALVWPLQTLSRNQWSVQRSVLDKYCVTSIINSANFISTVNNSHPSIKSTVCLLALFVLLVLLLLLPCLK